MGRDTPLGEKRKENTMWKEKALWSGPLEFLGNPVEFKFPFFFLMTRQSWISRCTLRECFPPSVHSVLACLFWCSRRGKRRCMDSRPDKCRSDISCHGVRSGQQPRQQGEGYFCTLVQSSRRAWNQGIRHCTYDVPNPPIPQISSSRPNMEEKCRKVAGRQSAGEWMGIAIPASWCTLNLDLVQQ